MDMNVYIGNVALGWMVASLALIAEHVVLWEQPWRLSEPVNYIVGVLTILAGCTIWAWRQAQTGAVDPWLAVIAFVFIAVGSGAWIVLAYGLRGRLRLKQDKDRRIGKIRANTAEALDDTLDDLRRN